jgi:hypothetical protein
MTFLQQIQPHRILHPSSPSILFVNPYNPASTTSSLYCMASSMGDIGVSGALPGDYNDNNAWLFCFSLGRLTLA